MSVDRSPRSRPTRCPRPCLVALACLIGRAEAAPPSPVVTLEQHAMPHGGVRTLFVLYADGRVIYDVRRHPTEYGSGYASAQLTKAEADALVAQLPSDEAWAALPANSDAAGRGVFDGLWQQICVWRPDKRCVGVRGVLYPGPGSHRAGASPAFLSAFDALIGFRDARAATWSPDEVELTFFPDTSRVRAKSWPGRWKLQLTQRPAEGRVSPAHAAAKLPGTELRALQVFLDDHKPVLVGGKKYYPHLSYRLPGQEQWALR